MKTEELRAGTEPLLEPISAESPCGEDLSSASDYFDLAALMEGTPEVLSAPGKTVVAAKPPDWSEVRTKAEKYLRSSMDLQVAVYFTVALMQIEGVAGAARGMELIAGMVRMYWDHVFPRLDPEDGKPTLRVNILSQLGVARGSFGDPVKFLDRFVTATVFRVPGLAVTPDFLCDDAKVAAQLETVTAAGDARAVIAGIEALRRTVAAAHAIDDFLIQTLGRDKVPSFDAIFVIVDKCLRVFDSLKGKVPEPPAVAPSAPETRPVPPATDPGTATPPPTAGALGEIRSHEDVRAALREIRAFYAAHEPASPVPFLLERAEKLVGKDFLTLLKNLTPAGVSEFDTLRGVAAGESAGSETPPAPADESN